MGEHILVLPVKREQVALKKPHTHRGVSYVEADIKKGVKIDITAKQKAALEKLGIV